jgi:pSer/pThr/pTyr-binding forkhead associated (FHA) protein
VKPLEVTIAGIKMRVEPTGQVSPQRTESLARELVRGLLGSTAAPSLELTRGPSPGKRELPPPEATWVIGRGDDATWVILDEDLSREHIEITRAWDGVWIRDLGSKNGTRVNGERIDGRVALRDGATIEAGNCELVFRDPAERHLQGELIATQVPVAEPKVVVVEAPRSPITFYVASSICVLATAGLIWVLAS